MKRIACLLNTPKISIFNSIRYIRYLRKEYLGEYLPKVDDKHLEDLRSSPFTKYSKINPKEECELNDDVPSSKIEKLYPEMFNYLPIPGLRDQLRENIERREMMKRRKHIHIPEFYVGCVMAATISDQYTATKTNRFLGLCIYRRNLGLLSSFRLRNVIDNIGIEVEFEIYNPTLIKVEVLKFEKRLDENLFYLRDAPYRYSEYPFDMVPEPYDPNGPIPINDLRVPLNPRPWCCNWMHHNYRGIDDSAWDMIADRFQRNAQNQRTSLTRYDLMMMYRDRGPLGDKHGSMRHVEVMHHDLMKYQEAIYRDEAAKLKRPRQ